MFKLSLHVRPVPRLTSLEWCILWQIAESEATFARREDGPRVWFRTVRDNVPGNHIAVAALLDAGLAALSRRRPRGATSKQPLRDSEWLTVSARGRRALRSEVASRNRPRPLHNRLSQAEMFDHSSDAWFTRTTEGYWFAAEPFFRPLWILEHDGPAVATTEGGGHRVAGRIQVIFRVPSFIDRGLAEQGEDGAVITRAGRDLLATRPDLTAVFEAERRAHRDHPILEGTAEERSRLAVGRGQGLYVCGCGWFTIYDNPAARQWADEFPAGGHWARLIDTGVLEITRERECGDALEPVDPH